LRNIKHNLRFEESFAENCIFLQKGLEGVVCHGNFAVQSTGSDAIKRLIKTSVQDTQTSHKDFQLLRGSVVFTTLPKMQEKTAEYTTHCILPSGGTWEIARPETGCEYSGDLIPKSQSASARLVLVTAEDEGVIRSAEIFGESSA